VETDSEFGSLCSRISPMTLGDIGLSLLGVVSYRPSLLQKPQRLAQVSRTSRRA
jgi:hypothetical protein